MFDAIAICPLNHNKKIWKSIEKKTTSFFTTTTIWSLHVTFDVNDVIHTLFFTSPKEESFQYMNLFSQYIKFCYDSGSGGATLSRNTPLFSSGLYINSNITFLKIWTNNQIFSKRYNKPIQGQCNKTVTKTTTNKEPFLYQMVEVLSW